MPGLPGTAIFYMIFICIWFLKRTMVKKIKETKVKKNDDVQYRHQIDNVLYRFDEHVISRPQQLL